MFANIFYHYKENKIYFWEFDEKGKVKKTVERYNHTYYVEDPEQKSEIKDVFGKPVIEKVQKEWDEIKRLKAANVYCCETDIPKDVAFLQKKYKNQNLIPKTSFFNIASLDIEISSENEFPKPEQAKYPINLLTVHLSKTNELYSFGLYPLDNTELVKNYYYCQDEKTLLERFCHFIAHSHIQILTGWNIQGFDIPYIHNRCQLLQVEQSLSSIGYFVSEKKDYVSDRNDCEWKNKIGGISILDYMYLYKKFQQEKKESYSLNFICMEEVNEGKLDFDGTINDLWKRDWNKFVEYNIQDVNLLLKLDKKMKYIDLVISLGYESLVPFENVFSTVSLVTGYVLKELHKDNIVVPDKKEKVTGEFDGAFVLAREGMYQSVMSYDVQSLYPTIMRMLNIDITTLILENDPKKKLLEDQGMLIKTSLDGVYYDKSKEGIIPKIVTKVFNDRLMYKKLYKEAKSKKDLVNAEYYDRMQYIRKIFINSVYGCFANVHFHFYNLTNAKAVTSFGQTIIKYLSKNINDYLTNYYLKGKKLKDSVVLIDTDSCFFHLEELKKEMNDTRPFLDFALDIDKTVLTPIVEKILKVFVQKYNAPQLIKFVRDKIIDKMMIQAMKKYATLLLAKEDDIYDIPKMKITGIEIVRTDTPSWCRKNLLSTIELMFSSMDKKVVIEYLKSLKQVFNVQPIETISFPRGISDYNKYVCEEDHTTNTLHYPSGCPIQVRAAINYNYINKKFDLRGMPISNGTKIKFFHCTKNNVLNHDIIAYVGNCPEKLKEMFKMDFEEQWQKSFQNKIERFFATLGWGEINLQHNLMFGSIKKKS